MSLINSRDELIARIEAKYKLCKTCGKKGVSRGHTVCFYCGSKK